MAAKMKNKQPSRFQFEIVSGFLLFEMIGLIGFFGWILYSLIFGF